jgi:hypothetical protein
MEIMHSIKRTAGGHSNGRVATNIKDSILTMKGMAMERCPGLMGVFIKVSGFMVYKMVLE